MSNWVHGSSTIESSWHAQYRYNYNCLNFINKKLKCSKMIDMKNATSTQFLIVNSNIFFCDVNFLLNIYTYKYKYIHIYIYIYIYIYYIK